MELAVEEAQGEGAVRPEVEAALVIAVDAVVHEVVLVQVEVSAEAAALHLEVVAHQEEAAVVDLEEEDRSLRVAWALTASKWSLMWAGCFQDQHDWLLSWSLLRV